MCFIVCTHVFFSHRCGWNANAVEPCIGVSLLNGFVLAAELFLCVCMYVYIREFICVLNWEWVVDYCGSPGWASHLSTSQMIRFTVLDQECWSRRAPLCPRDTNTRSWFIHSFIHLCSFICSEYFKFTCLLMHLCIFALSNFFHTFFFY